MRFISTRGAAPEVSFTQALLSGLAPDGGLYQPKTWPSFSEADLAALTGRPYAEIAAQVLGLFAGEEIEPAVLERLCAQAYASFSDPAVTPLRQLGPEQWLLELFHGPSLAFKDVAMQLLAQLYDHVLALNGQRLTIVCATSGDTGGAAVEAFRGRKAIRLVTLFPEGRISEIQRRFITTASEENVRAIAVDGDFDDCQALLKSLFADRALVETVSLAAVNSINFVRIAAQSVYYIAAALALGAPTRQVSFAVPTGNFGDAFAGWAARRMGLPVARILVATNANDILARALASGVYRRAAPIATQTPAMDIQAASNFERLVFEAAGRDSAMVRQLFGRFEQSGEFELDESLRQRIAAVFSGVSVSEAEARAAMRAARELIDPHTAVAVAGLAKAPLPQGVPHIVLATAHPAKFPESVLTASGRSPELPAAALRVSAATERFERAPARLEVIRQRVLDFADA